MYIPTDGPMLRLPGATITFAHEAIRIMNVPLQLVNLQDLVSSYTQSKAYT